jgi:hypothetical protein
MTDAERACRDAYTQRACDLGDDLACRQLRMAEEKKQKEAEKKAAAEERK